MIRKATATIRGISTYSPSKHYDVPKIGRETHADYEARTWRERIHANPITDEIEIPAMALKNALQGAASFLGQKIPGRGQKTFAAYFKGAVLTMEPMTIGQKKSEVPGKQFFVPSDGKTGGGSRVNKTFAEVTPPWGGQATFFVLDETITPKVFEEHLKAAGSFIGLGRFRPQNGGFYGRFMVDLIEWEAVEG